MPGHRQSNRTGRAERELQVARLIVDRRTNREIAAELS
jgi:DNA-binding CsgD family transcriptional regulator